MSDRIKKELDLLRRHYPNLEYNEQGQWVRIPDYPLPAGWNRDRTDVAFLIPISYPGTPPYGIYVPAGIRFNDGMPGSYVEPAQQNPPFGGSWGMLSWSTVDGQWHATASVDLAAAYTLLTWVRGFSERFNSGL